MSETEYQLIEDCPDFMYGCCQKYLDGDCSAHKCDLKIIRELEQKIQAKEQECEKLKFTIKHTGLLDLMNENDELKQGSKELKRGVIKQCPNCGEQFLSHIGAELFEENTKLKQELEMRKANEQESDEFWDGVFDKDYPFNKENAYKELADYYFILQQIPKIYCEITGETLSKTNYFASSVILAYRDNCERCQEKQEQEIKNFEKQLQEENKALKSENFTFEELIKTQEELIDKYKQALDEIDSITDGNLCDDDCDKCPDNCMCNWKEIKDIIKNAKEEE